MLDEPAGIVTVVTVVTDVPPELAANTPAVLLEDSVTVVEPAAVAGLLVASCSWTVTGPRVAVLDAAPLTAVLVRASLLAAETATVPLGALVVAQELNSVTTL